MLQTMWNGFMRGQACCLPETKDKSIGNTISATVVCSSRFTYPCLCRSCWVLDNALKVTECFSLTIKIWWIQDLFNQVLINSYSSHKKKQSVKFCRIELFNVRFSTVFLLDLPGPRLYMWWVTTSKELFAPLMKVLNQFWSKKPPGAMINGFSSIPL